MEMSVSFMETDSEMSASFGEVHEVLKVDDTKVSELPWSSKNTVDKLCPTFTEIGVAVRCEPVEGYPLTVTAGDGATTITRCGKNLLNDGWKDFGNYNTAKNFILSLPNGEYTASAKHTEPKSTSYLYLKKSTDGGATWTEHTRLIAGTRTNVAKFDVIEGEMWALWTSNATYLPYIESVQIEVGEEATAHEPYNKETFLHSETIPAWNGVNTLWADVGEITVKGKADPVAIIEKLSNAIVALGGNV